jgi:ribosomal protein RSM22 (predicted rRNA methylase)
MTETPQPTSGSLSARIIRACPKHAQCPLDCPERETRELGEVASFDKPKEDKRP